LATRVGSYRYSSWWGSVQVLREVMYDRNGLGRDLGTSPTMGASEEDRFLTAPDSKGYMYEAC